ncbi:hypothetical protein CAPN008_14340 [Capnocytophaga canis]|uniref:hypothetical protein n=1 Tax=Capnocytophaga canis TaxID=1848903 RepID=UPI001AC85020|nr:hypothetical protein [Capnocytophaga canis]GIM61384.1 hypothetical protein CAPN008_14340 [Capnocytophaga canis]
MNTAFYNPPRPAYLTPQQLTLLDKILKKEFWEANKDKCVDNMYYREEEAVEIVGILSSLGLKNTAQDLVQYLPDISKIDDKIA